MPLLKKQVETAYRKYAKVYDFVVKIVYPLLGLKIDLYRKKAVDSLELKPGDTVVDLGCGTGLNFPLLIEKIGPQGNLIGVDISTEMLSVAEKRVAAGGWSNVSLIHSDIDAFAFPCEINGLISTGVFGYLDQRAAILGKVHKSLVSRGKVVIIDGKRPRNWPDFLFKLFVKLSGPYGVTESYFDNDTPEIMNRLFQQVGYEEMYGGLLYLIAGEK